MATKNAENTRTIIFVNDKDVRLKWKVNQGAYVSEESVAAIYSDNGESKKLVVDKAGYIYYMNLNNSIYVVVTDQMDNKESIKAWVQKETKAKIVIKKSKKVPEKTTVTPKKKKIIIQVNAPNVSNRGMVNPVTNVIEASTYRNVRDEGMDSLKLYSRDEYDEDEYEDDEIDNSDLKYYGNNICFRVNDDSESRRNKIAKSEEVLCKKFLKLKEISSEDRMQSLVEGVFPEGFEKQMYIRNLTFEGANGHDVKILGIRPERTFGDFLEEYIPEGTSLLFKGHTSGKEFVIDSIHEIADTEQLDYEVDVVATPYLNPEMIRGGNFLYDVLEETASLAEHTEEKLQQWKEYLQWKRELASRQIYGCKYYKLTLDEEKRRLIFWLVFDGKEEFSGFRKYLSRDIQVFDNAYSTDKWHFNFAGKALEKKRRFNSLEVGRYRGVVDEYYLNHNNDVSDNEDDNEHLEDFEIEKEDELEEGNYDEIDNYDEYDDNVVSENDLCQEFDNPYIVQVAYELSQKDVDQINRQNLDNEGAIQYIRDYIMGNYFSDGFLALSAIGDFVLVSRFKQAISQLERDECYSPNLAMWLFNIGRARLPKSNREIVIDKWLNPRIEKNENQKNAIRKMIAAPDICLIQGPPGTGKTTVIAEAIYQFVRMGYRVLVASQSNDAVDNALERLVESPEIRAIRLGQKGKRKRKIEDNVTNKFDEEEVLKHYYRALSAQISKSWLSKWDELENGGIQYDTDIRDAKLYNNDIAELNAILTKLNTEYDLASNMLDNITKEYTLANERNTSLMNDQHQLRLAFDYYEGKSDTQFYLSEDMLRIFEHNLNDVIDEAVSKGVSLIESKLNFDVEGLTKEQVRVFMIMKNLTTLNKLIDKMKESKGQSGTNDGEILLLDSKISEVQQKLMECIYNEDEEGRNKYTKEIKELKRKRDELKFTSAIIEISQSERNVLSGELIKKIQGGATTENIVLLEYIMMKFDRKIRESFNVIKRDLQNRDVIDVSQYSEQIAVAQSKVFNINEEIRKIKGQTISKRQTLLNLRKKYEIEATNVDEIIAHITKLKEDNISLLEGQKAFRNDWEKTIRSFKNRLEDQDTYEYDQEYYQRIYINACNVVGISCTDNMRNLTDNGYDDFDVVIIDEVSKATPPELLIPLMKARKAILVGDHRQLPPMFKEHEVSYTELIENQDDMPEEVKDLLTQANFKRFQKMVTSSLFKEYFEQADESIKHSLLVQYRMHSDIMDIINRFYDQRLTCGLTEEMEKMEKDHGLTIKGVDGSTFVVPERHAYWIDSSATPTNIPIYEVRPHNSTSNYNVFEKYIVLELLKKIADVYKEQGYGKNNRKTVGVISFYQYQVNELKDAFRKARKLYDFSAIDVDINTVDRFQGKEKNIIIASLVRNNEKGFASKHIVAFERINVAFSRAQELLFIVGAKHMYENQQVQLPNMDMPGFITVPVYKNIMEGLNRKGCFRTSNKIITPEIENEVLQEYKELGGRS